jgi:hypothetical protein
MAQIMAQIVFPIISRQIPVYPGKRRVYLTPTSLRTCVQASIEPIPDGGPFSSKLRIRNHLILNHLRLMRLLDLFRQDGRWQERPG